jgi:thioredoxin reductase (NADPH)
MANKIGDYMANHNTKFIHKATPDKMEKTDDGKVLVTFTQDGSQKQEIFDTVLFAIGRYAVTSGCDLAKAGVVAEKNGKFKVNDEE